MGKYIEFSYFDEEPHLVQARYLERDDVVPIIEYLRQRNVKKAVSCCKEGWIRSSMVNVELEQEGFSPREFTTFGGSYITAEELAVNPADLGALILIYDPTDKIQTIRLGETLTKIKEVNQKEGLLIILFGVME